MTRYVVLVKPPDDHPGAARIYGTFRDREKAERLCQRVRKVVESVERWDYETSGYAWVMTIDEPRVREAQRWAVYGYGA